MTKGEPNMNLDDEDIVPTVFVRKALLLGTPLLVQSILTMPDTFTMPGYTLVPLEDTTECEPGMIYNESEGTFSAYVSPEPIKPVATAHELTPEGPAQ
ncbi:hypothetical protein AB6T85_21620 [Erwinia sp. ACCC 02193]|uniref:Uncharacterized protein n=1 Tax=Erwinia aeris TaxID=3239803 RepID=A0ABV4EDY2_9GAMM